MVESLEVEAGKGANDSIRGNDFTEPHFEDYCDMPYHSFIPDEEQDNIRLRIETWLFKNKILTPERINEIHKQHLSYDEWKMIENTPERYWSQLFASRMSHEERVRVDKGPHRDVVFRDKAAYRRYMTSSMVWTGVAESIYFQGHGQLPSADEEQRIISECSGPNHSCFFVLTERAAEIPVTYICHGMNWGENFIKYWENFRHQYEREHPCPRKAAA